MTGVYVCNELWHTQVYSVKVTTTKASSLDFAPFGFVFLAAKIGLGFSNTIQTESNVHFIVN